MIGYPTRVRRANSVSHVTKHSAQTTTAGVTTRSTRQPWSDSLGSYHAINQRRSDSTLAWLCEKSFAVLWNGPKKNS